VLLTAGEVLTGSELLQPGWVEVADGVVVAAGAGPPGRQPDHDFGTSTVVPGLVDTHVHGGGGGSFSDPDQVAAAVDLHQRHILVDVAEEHADLVLRKLAGVRMKGVALAPVRATPGKGGAGAA
jgi:N-acetylglucosamine-6-phosphate deacetylase